MNSKKSTPDEFYDYLNFYLKDADYNNDQRQIIKLLFTFGYKGLSEKDILKKKNLERLYKPYTTSQMLQLCDNFIQCQLNMDIDLFVLINILKEKIEQKIPLL